MMIRGTGLLLCVLASLLYGCSLYTSPEEAFGRYIQEKIDEGISDVQRFIRDFDSKNLKITVIENDSTYMLDMEGEQFTFSECVDIVQYILKHKKGKLESVKIKYEDKRWNREASEFELKVSGLCEKYHISFTSCPPVSKSVPMSVGQAGYRPFFL